jgi:hypothetical protein
VNAQQIVHALLEAAPSDIVDLLLEKLTSAEALAIFRRYGVDASGLDADGLKAARSRLAKKYHPDAGGKTEDMQRINAAYDVLVNQPSGHGSTAQGGVWTDRNVRKRPNFNSPNFADEAANYCAWGPRWTEAEPYIAADPEAAQYYAASVIRGRWPEAEPAIAKSANASSLYAHNVLHGRFPLGEPAIASQAKTACDYTRYIIKGRWPPGEEAISKDPYETKVLKRFLAGEPWSPY